MKLRWWVVGIAAVAVGSIFMIKHLVDDKKPFLPFVDNDKEIGFGKFPHENLEVEFDGEDFLA